MVLVAYDNRLAVLPRLEHSMVDADDCNNCYCSAMPVAGLYPQGFVIILTAVSLRETDRRGTSVSVSVSV